MEEKKPPRPRAYLTREQGAQIVSRRRGGETYPSLARDFGVSVSTVTRVVEGRYTGWKKPPKVVRLPACRAHREPGDRLFRPDQVRQIRRMRDEGCTLGEIGNLFRIADSTVSRIARGLIYADVGGR